MKIAVTCTPSLKTAFYLYFLHRRGMVIDNVFLQANTYRRRRDLKVLKQQPLKHLLRFLQNIVFRHVLDSETTFTARARYLIRRVFRGLEPADVHRVVRECDEVSIDISADGYLIQNKIGSLFGYEALSDRYRFVAFLKLVFPKSDIRITNNLNRQAKLIKGFDFDVLVVIGGGILKSQIISVAKQCTITIHNSRLPRLRGWGGGEIWAMIHGDVSALGQSIFYTDTSIDGGDIVLQETCPIEPDDTLDEIILRNTLIGARLLAKSLALFSRGIFPRKPQDDIQATYIGGGPNPEEFEVGLRNLEGWKAAANDG